MRCSISTENTVAAVRSRPAVTDNAARGSQLANPRSRSDLAARCTRPTRPSGTNSMTSTNRTPWYNSHDRVMSASVCDRKVRMEAPSTGPRKALTPPM
ncbi:hypothetical protein G6F22_020353 [Rhizopus arrhizus]|nr:hypothetical protein G6F22_020353 [Rhizopus arrhizus]